MNDARTYYFPHLLFRSIFLLTLMCLLNVLLAQVSKRYNGYQQNYYKGMRYGLFKPANYSDKKAYPLIVYLHGSTDTVSRDLIWYEDSIQKENPCFVLSPKTEEPNQGWGNTWERNHAPAMQNTLALVDSLIQHYNIDTSRLYIYGISMGGFGVFSVLSKEAGKFAGAYAVCGGSNEAAASDITTPLWIFHGAEDDVVPVRLSKNVYEAMVNKGNKTVRYTEYPGVKHNSWENVSLEKSLSKWLLSQQKGKSVGAPKQVENLTLKKQFNSAIHLQWNQGLDRSKEVWYYKIFRDGELIGEVNANKAEFQDYKYKNNSGHQYYVVAVNYLFKDSKPSNVVKIE